MYERFPSFDRVSTYNIITTIFEPTPSKSLLLSLLIPYLSKIWQEIIAVDLAPLYDPSFTPKFVFALRDYYIATYSDRFFSPQAPAWFRVYIWMEALYHIPLSIWALKGLWQGTLYLYEMRDLWKLSHCLLCRAKYQNSSFFAGLIQSTLPLPTWRAALPIFVPIILSNSCLHCSYLSFPALPLNKKASFVNPEYISLSLIRILHGYQTHQMFPFNFSSSQRKSA